MTEHLPDNIDEKFMRAEHIEAAATALLIACAVQIRRGVLDERGMISDATLRLRDALNPDWPANPDWWPEGAIE